MLLGLAACGKREPEKLIPRIDAALARGADFLRKQQGPDGAIRSSTYAYFKDGYSLTPLALAALFAVEDDVAVAKGRDYLATMVDATGGLRSDVAGPRYPLYSAALGIIVLNRSPAHVATRDALVRYLEGRELPAGGWGYDESPDANLSATLYVIGALALAGVKVGDKAQAFVESCQNFPGDGGFFFSTTLLDGNKAGRRGGGWRSYGSMTADGLRALLRLGHPLDDPRVVAAGDWLERHFEAARNPGNFVEGSEIRQASSYYYWAWSGAHALRALGRPTLKTDQGTVRWAEALAEELLKRQRPDGSWANDASEMREDDPVVATSFAVAALAVCKIALGGEYRTHAR